MKFFSRVSLNFSGTDTQAFARIVCTDGYNEHQQIWRLFATDSDALRDFLFRREQTSCGLVYYVLSQRPPRATDDLWEIRTKEYAPKLMTGQILTFCLRVNPVVTKHDKSGRHVRHDIVMDAKRNIGYKNLPPDNHPSLQSLVHEVGIKWLSTRAEKHGYALDEKSLRVDGYQQHRTYKPGSRRPIQFSTLDFNGRLTVTDTERFLNALINGIGPAKGFGCGMMLVRRG